MTKQKSNPNSGLKTILKKIKYNYKNIFIFILFFISVVKLCLCEVSYYSENNNPCDPTDSWALYRNQYEDTIIVTDPYNDGE